MIPESAEITVEQGTIIWRNEDFMISLDQAEAIGEEIKSLMADSQVDSVLVDNREANGTWPTNVNDYWPELMREMYENEIDCATVSPSVTNSMQINQLAEDAGMNDRIKAFKTANYQDAIDFLGVED
jgi:hypothetical protein